MSLNLVLDYESSALAAPQSFRDAMQAAANILDAAIFDNITVTIRVGYGDWNNNQDTGITTGAEGGSLNGLIVSYTSLRTALAGHETSPFDQTFVSSLPSASSVNGVSSFFVPSAVAKAVGLLSPTSSSVDGAVGMGTQIPTNLLIGAALHELTHAMGREPGVGPFDLFRYTSPGNHLFTSGSTAVPAYFSIDGGNTKLADFGQTSDAGDFLTTGIQGSNDPFDEFYNSHTTQSLTNVDKELLDVMGFTTMAPTTTVIESNGATSLTEITNHFYLYDSTASGPSLKFASADYIAGAYGGWTPIAAEKIAAGYEVAWKVVGADQYTVWTTDSNGNYISNTPVVTGTSVTLESLEPSFSRDLNGDGHLGVVATVVEANGTTSLTEIGGHYYLYDSTGSGPSLKFASADYIAGAYGGWMPIAAEKIAAGYEVAWKVVGADQYTVWTTDSNGNYISNTPVVTGTSVTLESLEPSFSQDLNGDGHIGVPSRMQNGGSVNSASKTLVDAQNSTLDGSIGLDAFVFKSNVGANEIHGFTSGTDVPEFSQSLFANADDVLDHAHQVGSDTLITHDPQNVVIIHTELAHLYATDIHII